MNPAARTFPVDRERFFAETRANNLSVDSVRFDEVSASAVSLWARWQRAPDFSSPYFHPKFTQCASRVRDDVRVSVIQSNGQIVGFFPWQLRQRGVAEPVGGAINDCQGIVTAPDAQVSAASVLASLPVSRFHFHAWTYTQQLESRFVYEAVPAYMADFSTKGPLAWLDELRGRSNTIRRQPQKTRKLAREFGPLRFELQSTDPKMLERMIALKRAKYLRTGVVDFFGVKWTRDLLKEIHRRSTAREDLASEDFQGVHSVLYAGETPVAFHFGMKCGQVLHYWYPVFSPEFARYSPGTQLYLEIVRRSEELGISKIDFGYGDDPYKLRLTNRQSRVLRGVLDANSVRLAMNRTADRVVQSVKSSRFREPVKNTVRRFVPRAGQPIVSQ